MAEHNPIRPPDNGNRMARFSKTGAFWLLLVLISVLAFQFIRGQDETVVEFSSTAFRKELERSNIL